MSLVATFVSGITLLGTSTEIYVYGIQYAYILAGPAVMGIFMYFVTIPVFHDLKVVSMFEVRNLLPDNRREAVSSYLLQPSSTCKNVLI